MTTHFTAASLLRQERATRDAVLRELPHHAVHHLTCHGIAVLTSPLDSALVLADDEQLTLRDLLNVHLADTPLGGARLVSRVRDSLWK